MTRDIGNLMEPRQGAWQPNLTPVLPNVVEEDLDAIVLNGNAVVGYTNAAAKTVVVEASRSQKVANLKVLPTDANVTLQLTNVAKAVKTVVADKTHVTDVTYYGYPDKFTTVSITYTV